MVDVNNSREDLPEVEPEFKRMVALLRDMHGRLLDRRPLTKAQSGIFIAALGRYLKTIDEGGNPSLDRAFGLRIWGGVSPVRQDALFRRDAMILRLWRNHEDFRDLTPFAAAKQMVLDADRYRAGRWKRERSDSEPPSSQPASTWWHILMSGQRIPAERQIREILKGKSDAAYTDAAEDR